MLKKMSLLAFTASLLAMSANAGTRTWIASGGGSWTNAANWDVPPANGDLVVFNNGANMTVTDVPTLTLERITVSSGLVTLQANIPATLSIDDPADNTATVDISVGGGVYFAIGDMLTLRAAGSDIRGTVGTAGSLQIATGGTLDLGGTEAVISGNGIVNVNSGGALVVGSALGIVTAASGSSGNIQTSTRTFSTTGNYTYAPAAGGVTGNALPTTVNNLTINPAAGTVTLSQNVIVSAALTVSNGTFTVNTGSTLNISGTLSVAGTLNMQGGNLAINGAGSNLTLPAITGTIGSMTINRANGVTMTSNLANDGNLNLTSGILNTGGYTFTHGTTAQRTVTRSAGFIVGTLARYISTATGNRTFPISNGTIYLPVTISYTVAPSTAGIITVGMTEGPGGIAVAPLDDAGYTINRRSRRYWEISYGSVSGGTFTVSMPTGGMSGITNDAEVRIIHSGDNGSTFDLVGSHSTGGGGTAYRANVPGNTAGRFYLAGNLSENPLPLKLISFVAQVANRRALLSWNTANESDMAGFEVYRADDGIHFERISTYLSESSLIAKNTPGGSYRFTDLADLSDGSIYQYKIVAVGTNGERQESPVRSLHISNTASASVQVTSISPNPANDRATLLFQLSQEQSVTVELMSMTGGIVSVPVHRQLYSAGNHQFEVLTNHLPAGVYTVKLSTASGSAFNRFVVNH